MNKLATFVALGPAILAAAAWGADYVVERAASAPANSKIPGAWPSRRAGAFMLRTITAPASNTLRPPASRY